MSLTPGDRIGPYEVLSPLGAGGMGEVYRARDSKLGRDVALKLLPAAFAGDPERLAQLAREARLLAALNHPNVATIHGFEDSGHVRALVMELVEGPTLAEKLAQDSWGQAKPGVLLAEALRIAGQIAQGLDAAHAKGIIHRDLKPGNIKLTHDGSVKVLDFGLARAFSADGTGSDVFLLPTITTDLHPGAIAGTPAYMSPEQARGQVVDKRTDIWAFGCVLYEMLTGRLAFPGQTISDSIAAILEREPDWKALPAHTPAGIRQLLRRCLEKDQDRRLHDIADARIEIDDVRSGAPQDGAVASASAGTPAWVAGALAVGLLAIAAAAAGVWALRPVSTTHEARLEINTPPTRDASLAISPDGLKIVFVVTAAGQSQLWLRSLDSLSPRLLPGTERATLPFWSPDSRSIGFFADVNLKRMEIDGGSAQTLTSRSAVPIGGTWNRDGTILFADNPVGPIYRIPAAGGERVAATQIRAPDERGHAVPQFLPDGRHFLFFATGSAAGRGVHFGELGRLDSKRLLDAAAPATYAATGHLLFVRDGKLLAQGFDPEQGELRGDAFPIDDRPAAWASLSAAAGAIAYRSGSADTGQRQLQWVDRSGRERDKMQYPDGSALGPSLSPDGRRIALFRFANGNMDLWSYDVGRRTWDRMTFDPGDDIYPLWSPDGGSIVFGAARNSSRVSLYRRLLSAPPEREELLLSSATAAFPVDWSADGRFLLYSSPGVKGDSDLWALPLQGERKPFEVAKTDFSEGLGQFSPDGKWVAYESDQTGRLELYLRPFPGPGIDTRVSTEGGSQARWNRNGKELFYVAANDALMAVPIRFSPDQKTVEPGTPLKLFVTNVGSTAVLKFRQQYMVSPDGQSFIMNAVAGEGSASPITVILNWKPTR